MQNRQFLWFAAFLAALSVNAALAAEPAAQVSGERASGDRQAILALLGRLESGFAAGDAKALAACWTEGGEFVGLTGSRIAGRKELETHFQQALVERKPTLKLHLANFRLVNDGLALVEANAEIKAAGESAAPPLVSLVLVKVDGKWLVESAREIEPPPQATNHLKDLEWLVGQWAGTSPKTGATVHISCDWTANQSFLIRKFKIEGKGTVLHGGTEIIGWDPRTSRFRSWVFEIDGGFGENLWVRDGARWLIKYSGTLANGGVASLTQVLTVADANTIMLESKDRVVNGIAEPDLPPARIERQAAAEEAQRGPAPAKGAQ